MIGVVFTVSSTKSEGIDFPFFFFFFLFVLLFGFFLFLYKRRLACDGAYPITKLCDNSQEVDQSDYSFTSNHPQTRLRKQNTTCTPVGVRTKEGEAKVFSHLPAPLSTLDARIITMPSVVESYNRGSLVAVPDPAKFYRNRLCASVGGGGGTKRHPVKAVLAGKFHQYYYFHHILVYFRRIIMRFRDPVDHGIQNHLRSTLHCIG